MPPRVRFDAAPDYRGGDSHAGAQADAMQDVAAAAIDGRLANRSLEDWIAMTHRIHAPVAIITMRSPENGSEWTRRARERSDVQQLGRGFETVAGEEAQGRHILAQGQPSLVPEAQQALMDDSSHTGHACDWHADLACSTCGCVLVLQPWRPG